MAPGSHNQQVRIFAGFQQSGGSQVTDEYSLDVHAVSSDGLQCVGLETLSGVKGVVTAAVLYR